MNRRIRMSPSGADVAREEPALERPARRSAARGRRAALRRGALDAVRLPAVAATLVGLGLAAVLLPVFQTNVLAPGDTYFFTSWDTESQALVLAEIEQDVTGRSDSPYGLQNALPDVQSPYATFDSLKSGAQPTSTGYAPYPSSLGLQGRLFDLLYHSGATTLARLETIESLLFSIVLVAFLAVLARSTRLSLAVVALLTSVLSPWVVSAAHNLYWVPWSWLLPATAAGLGTLVTSRRARVLCLVGVGAATALKASMGYEFLTTTTLLAAAMPVLSAVLRAPRPWRAVARAAALVFAAAVAGFIAVLVVHLFVAGGGDPVAGGSQIAADALKRTYGPVNPTLDGITRASLQTSPLRVLALYLVDWRTSLLSVGVGGPFTVLALGPGSFWVLVVAACAVPVVAFTRGDRAWRRDAVLIGATALPAVSWFVVGKSHAFTATSVCFVLWYLIFVPTLFWVLLSALARSGVAGRLRTASALLASAAGSASAPALGHEAPPVRSASTAERRSRSSEPSR